MDKRLTLEQAWKHCLEMWKWIAQQKKRNSRLDISDLKEEWIKGRPCFKGLSAHCFFCEYAEQQGVEDCSFCPGKLVSKRFHCIGNRTYNFAWEPIKFYNKLLELNEKRKKQK